MSKSDDRELAALVKKTAAKVAKSKPKARRKYDDTLRRTSEEEEDAQALFSEMKKREF